MEGPIPRASVLPTTTEMHMRDDNELFPTLSSAALCVLCGEKALSLQMAGGGLADLSHWHYDTFLVRRRDPLFREYFSTRAAFSLNPEGHPDGFAMRLHRGYCLGAANPAIMP